MHSKTINAAMGEKTWALIFETGDEVAAGLQRFAQENHLAGSHFTAIGALSDVVLAWFDWQTKDYRKIPVREQVVVLSLIGDVADDNGKPKVHAHIVIGKSDGTAHGGHLIEAHVRPTLELILSESPRHLRRRFDPETGLALISV
jgi:predicted DNA-binding protein with PD1-like motif